MRVALLVVLEIVGILALLIFAATIAIPFASPPPTRPTPTLPPGVFLDCPHSVPGCR